MRFQLKLSNCPIISAYFTSFSYPILHLLTLPWGCWEIWVWKKENNWCNFHFKSLLSGNSQNGSRFSTLLRTPWIFSGFQKDLTSINCFLWYQWPLIDKKTHLKPDESTRGWISTQFLTKNILLDSYFIVLGWIRSFCTVHKTFHFYSESNTPETL